MPQILDFINRIQTNSFDQTCYQIQRIPNTQYQRIQTQSSLSAFLERGVEFLIFRLFSFQYYAVSASELQCARNCANSHSHSTCINPHHITQVAFFYSYLYNLWNFWKSINGNCIFYEKALFGPEKSLNDIRFVICPFFWLEIFEISLVNLNFTLLII